MKTISIILAVAASVVAGAPTDFSASVELKLNVEGSPVIGKLTFIESMKNGISGYLDFDNTLANLAPGTYSGFIHESADFSRGCNSTGQFVTYWASSTRPFLRPADITIHKQADKSPSVFFLNHATLVSGKQTTITNRPVVFHDRSVMEALNQEKEVQDPGLHRTSVFCGLIKA